MLLIWRDQRIDGWFMRQSPEQILVSTLLVTFKSNQCNKFCGWNVWTSGQTKRWTIIYNYDKICLCLGANQNLKKFFRSIFLSYELIQLPQWCRLLELLFQCICLTLEMKIFFSIYPQCCLRIFQLVHSLISINNAY